MVWWDGAGGDEGRPFLCVGAVFVVGLVELVGFGCVSVDVWDEIDRIGGGGYVWKQPMGDVGEILCVWCF